MNHSLLLGLIVLQHEFQNKGFLGHRSLCSEGNAEGYEESSVEEHSAGKGESQRSMWSWVRWHKRILVPNLQTTYELRKSSVTVVPAWKSWAKSHLQQTLGKESPESLREALVFPFMRTL